MSHRTRALLAIVLQLLILIAIAVKPLLTLTRGTIVLLETVPVDPRDLFRGDYVMLNYKITTLDPAALGLFKELRKGEVVYVGLVPRGKYWTAKSMHLTPPEGLYLRGTVSSAEGFVEARISYGIESFFVPEGRGREIERARDRLSVEVAIARDGSAVIRRIFLGDAPFP